MKDIYFMVWSNFNLELYLKPLKDKTVKKKPRHEKRKNFVLKKKHQTF